MVRGELFHWDSGGFLQLLLISVALVRGIMIPNMAHQDHGGNVDTCLPQYVFTNC